MDKFNWGTVLVALVCLAIFVIFLAGAMTAHGETLYVNDGDTITVNGEKIRLLAVDAPEKLQEGGQEAREWLLDKVRRGNIRIERHGKDKYGRTLAYVHQGRTSLNRELVRAGMAWAYVQYSDLYVDAQDEAYKARRGIWADPTCPPLAPWIWRRQNR